MRREDPPGPALLVELFDRLPQYVRVQWKLKPIEVEDVVQETARRVTAAKIDLSRPPVQLWSFVRIAADSIIRNLRRKRLRPRTIEVGLNVAAPDKTPIEHAFRAECSQRLGIALSALPLDLRDVIFERYFAGLTVIECAQALNCDQSTVKRKTAHALAVLRSDRALSASRF